jgi:hypothetical protein
VRFNTLMSEHGVQLNNTLLTAVLSYVAVIGATPLGARAPAEAIDHPQMYAV